MPVSKIARSALLPLLVLAAVGCGGKPDPTTPGSQTLATGGTATTPPKQNTPEAPPQGEDLSKVKPEIVFTPDKMKEEFGKDQKAFLTKYGGKVIDVIGTVEMVVVTGWGDTGRLVLGPGVNTFECVEPFPMDKAMPGQKVTLRGKCSPYSGVEGWSIVAVEGDPPATVTAEQLVKEHKADPKGTVEKYSGKYLVVTGQVQAVTKEVGTTITLTAADVTPAVTCFFGVSGEKVAKAHGWLTVGQPVRVLGKYGDNKPEFYLCAALPPVK